MMATRSAHIPDAVYEAAVCGGLRWIRRAHSPCARPEAERRALVRMMTPPIGRRDRAGLTGSGADPLCEILLGATHAAFAVEGLRGLRAVVAASELPPPDLLDGPYECRVLLADRRVPPLRTSVMLLPLSSYGLDAFADCMPFWGAIRPNTGGPLADFAFSVEPEARARLAALMEEPQGRLIVRRQRFDLLDLSLAGAAAGGASLAVRRGRLGYVFRFGAGLWAAIESRREDSP